MLNAFSPSIINQGANTNPNHESYNRCQLTIPENGENIGSLYTGFKASFPLRESFGEFQRCLSFDDKFYALKSSVFKDVGGFDSNYFDYLYYLDDYFARCRQELDSHAVFTNETAVKHEVRDDKPDDSMALNNNSKIQFFRDTWKGNQYITAKSMRGEPLKVEEIRVSQ